MKIYFASGIGKDLIRLKGRDVLISYFYSNKSSLDFKKEYGFRNYFIDSGAYSAYTQKQVIDIDEYSEWVKKQAGTYDVVAALAVIGDGEGSLKNARYMRDVYGLKVLPCYHYGDDWSLLDDYCKEWDYVALGGLVGGSVKRLRLWLNVVFSKYPNHKFHGFGLTSFPLMEEYPWHSVDSSTFLQARAYGELQTCVGRIYIGVQKDKPGAFKKLPEFKKQMIRKEAVDFNIDFDEMMRSYAEENNADLILRYNIEFFQRFVDNLSVNKFAVKQPQLNKFFNDTTDKLKLLKEKYPYLHEEQLKSMARHVP